jgi:hypothetical protein
MSHDDRQQPTDPDVNEDALDATEELSEEALDGVSGGVMYGPGSYNTNSPFD